MTPKTLAIIIPACLLGACSIAALPSTDAEEKERYRCTTIKASGFNYDEKTKEWKNGRFERKEKKYIIKESSSGKAKLEIIEIANKEVICWSEEGYLSSGDAYFDCLEGNAVFQKGKGSYFRTYLIGDEGDAKKEPDTPYMEIGNCSAI
jgi:hypothetical protein